MRRATVLFALTLLMGLPRPVDAIGGSRHCDFDGDGYDDAAIGVPGEDLQTGSPMFPIPLPSAGAVNVIYGSAAGLAADGNQVFTANATGGAMAGESFGTSVECGDFDGDGYADLAVGAPFAEVDGVSIAGAVHVLFGSAEGLSATGAMRIHRAIPGVTGVVGEDRFGKTLAAGDFDNDGRDDLAVGAPTDAVAGHLGGGSVQVFYGSSEGLTFDGDQIWRRNKPGVRGNVKSNARFGGALAVGDFDGDGDDDLAVGAGLDDVNGKLDAGTVSVFYGSNKGLTTDGNDFFHRDRDNIKGIARQDDFFGIALAAGDFDGDGDDELAIGVSSDDIGGVRDAGSVHVLQGGPNGLRTKGDTVWHRGTAGVVGIPKQSDAFGLALTVGRFDADDFHDLAIAVPSDDVDGITDAGSINVLYGSETGLTPSGDQLWHQDRSGIADVGELGDRFARHVAAADFDGSGEDDLLIGVPYEDDGNLAFSGRVAVIYGAASRLRALGNQSWTRDTPGIFGLADSNDGFGAVSGQGR